MITMLIAFFTFFLFTLTYAQNCGMPNLAALPSTSSSNFSNLKFYQDENCKPLRVKVNYVILTRDDGTGGMDNTFLNSITWNPNSWWEKVSDIRNCELGDLHPSDANVRFDIQVHYEANTSAWDYYSAKSNATSSTQNNFCPGSSLANNWPELDTVVQQYRIQYPDRINIFFVENGAQLSYYENAILNNIDIPAKWEDVDPNPSFSNIFDGCSFSPDEYYETNSNEYIIMANSFTDYLGLLNFGHIEQDTVSISNSEKADDYKWLEAAIINHEVGHSFRLRHRCACVNDLMLSSNVNNPSTGKPCKFQGDPYYIGLDYLETIHNSLATRAVHKYVECGAIDENNCNVTTIGNSIITKPMNIYGDLIIKSGHTVTLKDEVFLSSESSIDIESGGKLIVDGGKLTTLCEFETWKGIRVTGGNSDFDVQTMNGALIENTSGPAISMVPPNIPWPEIQNYGNGIVIADNTTFLNCERMAGLIAYSPSDNKSKFTNCTQIGGKYGITNWHCEGVVVDNCTFENITEHCVGAYDGSYDLIGNCDFYGGTAEVLFTNTKAGKESLIQNNTFNTAPIGLHAMGTHTGILDINNNLFNNSAAGIYMNKLNKYYIYLNSFNNPQFGVYCEQNGVNILNDIEYNIFEGDESGIVSLDDNDMLSFIGNCFNSTFMDVEIYGLVAPVMGGFLPAENCFTHKGSTASSVIDMGGNLEVRPNLGYSFVYTEPDDYIENCIDAEKADPSIFIQKVISPTIYDFCEDLEPEEPYTPCDDPERNVDDLNQSIANLQAEIESTMQSNLSETQKLIEINQPERCLAKFKSQLYDLYLENENYADAEALFTPAQNFDDHITIFSTKLAANDLFEANQYLDEINYNTEAELDFRTIQKVNIERLQNGPDHQLSALLLNDVLTISEKDHSYAGLAKSLYYQISGILAPVDLTLPRQEAIAERSESKKSFDPKSINVYPNPVTDLLQIDLVGYENVKLTITNLSGILIYSDTIDSNNFQLNTVHWSSGIYILQLKNGEEILETRKLTCLK